MGCLAHGTDLARRSHGIRESRRSRFPDTVAMTPQGVVAQVLNPGFTTRCLLLILACRSTPGVNAVCEPKTGLTVFNEIHALIYERLKLHATTGTISRSGPIKRV